MSLPVVDTTSSVLSFPQWLDWNFFFKGTNSPYSFRAVGGGFPPGMTLQPQWPGTGATSGSLFTVTGHPFVAGTIVVMSSFTGGGTTTLASNTLYYVTNISAPGGTFSLALLPGGTPITFSADITAVTFYQPGLLAGAATLPGISPVDIVATNADGDSATPVEFTIGISAAAVAPDSNVDFIWDMGTNTIIPQTSSTPSTTPLPRATPVLFAKEQDDVIMRVQFVKNGTVLDLSGGDTSTVLNNLKLVLKQFEPEVKTVVSDGSVQVGVGGTNTMLVHAKLAGDLLAAALSNYEADSGTFFSALAELEITFPNPFPVGGETCVRTSQTFTIQIERDLGEGS